MVSPHALFANQFACQLTLSDSCLIYLIQFLVTMTITYLSVKCLEQSQAKNTDPVCKPRKPDKPFSVSIQHVKNVNIMVQCEECEMWRLVYSKSKLSVTERASLQQALDDVTYTCGAQLRDLGLSGKISEVCCRDLWCNDPIEKLYYSAGYTPICIFCAADVIIEREGFYPQCENCTQPPTPKRR